MVLFLEDTGTGRGKHASVGDIFKAMVQAVLIFELEILVMTGWMERPLPKMTHTFKNCYLQRRRQSIASPISSLKNCTYAHIYFPVEVGSFTSFFDYIVRGLLSSIEISHGIFPSE